MILKFDSQGNRYYESTSGTKYQYDLSNPTDKLSYDTDLDAKMRDSLNINLNVELDRALGQFGGGILK